MFIILIIFAPKNKTLDITNQTNINNMTKAMPAGRQETIIRPPAAAGTFYPANENELKNQIDKFLNNVESENYKNLYPPKLKERRWVRAMIVPHAGIIYSGQTAAYAFKQLEGQNIKKVVLIGPAHYEYLNKFGLSHADFWQTPLGNVEIDQESMSELEKHSEFGFADFAMKPEHSLEIEIPFLQIVLNNNWKLIPIITGRVSDDEINSAAEHITEIIDEQTVIIISTDLSHYHFKQEANEIDKICINSIEKLEFDSECEACGEIGFRLILKMAKKLNWKSEVLNYSDSGDITGDVKVVGYVSALFTGNVNKKVKSRQNYSNKERQYLLKLARDTIKYAFENKGKTMPVDKKELSDKFKEKRGVFVTLHKNGQLRGCIGYIEPIEKLYLAVQNNALSAAFNDSRFSPLKEKELDDCEIEISILTVPQETKLSEIKPRIDGVILKQGLNQSTYLPQVWESIGDAQEFYSSLCMKAGLSMNCYNDPDTKFYKYQAEIFHE